MGVWIGGGEKRKRTDLGCLDKGEAEGTQRVLKESVGLGHVVVFRLRGGPTSVNNQAVGGWVGGWLSYEEDR